MLNGDARPATVPLVTIAADVQVRVDHDLAPGTVEFAEVEPVGFFRLPPGILVEALLDEARKAREDQQHTLEMAAKAEAFMRGVFRQAQQALDSQQETVCFRTVDLLKLLSPKADR